MKSVPKMACFNLYGFFAIYINNNIFKCIQIALNTESFMHIILIKKKNNQLSKIKK